MPTRNDSLDREPGADASFDELRRFSLGNPYWAAWDLAKTFGSLSLALLAVHFLFGVPWVARTAFFMLSLVIIAVLLAKILERRERGRP